MRLVWLEEGGGATCAELLATVPHWFGIAEANEDYQRVADRCPTTHVHAPLGGMVDRGVRLNVD